MTQEPLIFTAKGNLPVSSLTHDVEWRVGADQIIFIERYLLNGEVVKESAHVKILAGVALSGEASL